MRTFVHHPSNSSSSLPRSHYLDLRDRKRLTLLGDILVSILASIIALTLWSWTDHGRMTPSWIIHRSFWIPLLTTLWIMALALAGNYVAPYAFHKKYVFRSLALAMFIAIGIYMSVYYIAPRTLLPRLVTLTFVTSASVLTSIWREVWYDWLNEHAAPRSVILVGEPPNPSLMADFLHVLKRANYHVLGRVDVTVKPDPAPSSDDTTATPLMGTIHDLPDLVDRFRPAEIIFMSETLPAEITGILTRCHLRGVAVSYAAEVFEILTGRVSLDWFKDNWLRAISLNHQGTSILYQVAKRTLDIIGASIGILLFFPMLPFIALAIRLDSPGPIFYFQKRVGKGGREFTIWKLRTMRADAEKSKTPQWATPNDPRVTRVGRWLRKFRIDEFPQFWNILKGEMSAVGPRPERPEFEAMIEKYIPMYPLRHAVKPGMAGWAMIHFDYVDSVEDARTRLEYDLFYIKHQSLWLDILIILQASLEILLRRGR